MAIRLRRIQTQIFDGESVDHWIALCAARSIPKQGDIYLHDGLHHALSTKFAGDFNSSFDCDIPFDDIDSQLIDVEESNNPNRENWDVWIATGLPTVDG